MLPVMSVEDMIDAEIALEGGYVNNPNDPGGPTRYGITQAVARSAGYAGPIEFMPREVAFDVLRHLYYSAPNFDQVYALSRVIGVELVDVAINEGVPHAAGFLQTGLNTFNENGKIYPKVTIDNSVGATTLACLRSFLAYRGPPGETIMMKAITCLRGARYIDIGEHNSKLSAFEFGWFAKRVTF